MPDRAPRLSLRLWHAPIRGAVLILALVAMGALGLAAGAGQAGQAASLRAEFLGPTDRYPHGVLGDDLEWSALRLVQGARALTVTLPTTRVFEDLAPRIITTPSGRNLAMVVQSDARLGARLALYDIGGLVVATPFIGHRFRWLAPVGAADLDGDGQLELAFVDRPHLRKTLRLFRLSERGRQLRLTPVAEMSGVSNHQIGWDYIASGIRDCGSDAPQIIVPDATYQTLLSVRFDGKTLTSARLGAYAGRAAVSAHLRCGG